MTKKRVILAVALVLAVGVVAARWDTGQYFDSAGVRIHYTDQGKGEPVVLVHGFLASYNTNWRWPGVIRALRRTGYRVKIDPDGNRGFFPQLRMRGIPRNGPLSCGRAKLQRALFRPPSLAPSRTRLDGLTTQSPFPLSLGRLGLILEPKRFIGLTFKRVIGNQGGIVPELFTVL